jgi:hypothetical protein
MDLIQRAKNICLSPASEWAAIASEPTSAMNLITGYVAPLAAIGAVAGLIGGSLVGRTLPFVGTYRVPFGAGLAAAVFAFVMAVVGVLILSLIINALAPRFGGEKDSTQALKVAVYSYTPAWIAAVLQILPALGMLVMLAALYGLYLLYLGLPRLMKCPPEKAGGYTAVVVVCAIVISVVVAGVGATIVGVGTAAGGMFGMTSRTPAVDADVRYDPSSALGKLQSLGDKLEESQKKMDAAEKSGDQAAQVAAATEALGTLFGGGKRFEPVALEQLKPFLPDTFAGMPRRSSNSERNGIAGLMVAKAEATYGDESEKNATLEITDTGGMSGLVGLAGWVNAQGESEDEDHYERTAKSDGRLVHEERSKRGGDNEYTVVLGDRFVVSAKGSGINLDALKAAMGSLNLAKLESMKDAGAQK